MKKGSAKWAVTVICVLAAGVCYSCGGVSGSGAASGVQTLMLAEETAAEAPEGESAEPEGDPAGQAAETSPSATVCYVHVCGEVMRPGVYELEAGSRIYEAVELAGGFTQEAAASYLNLAQEIADGMKIEVPSEADLEKLPETPAGTAGAVPDDGKVNINTADKASLMTLKGIGEAKAEDIISYRDSNGPFGSIEDIMKVPGIKNAAFEKIKDDITV